MRARLATAIVAFAIGAWAMPAAAPVHADTTFVVNRTGDASDLNLANDSCDTSTNAGSQCTLRAAIQEANDTPGTDTINFNISTASKVIRPNSPLPSVTDRVFINGYTQPGAAENTQAIWTNAVLRIVLDGINAGQDASGLVLESAGSVVRGLVIQNWDDSGVRIVGPGDSMAANVIAGCYIGTNAAGTIARGNNIGISVEISLQVIGGDSASSRNVISGNDIGIRVAEGVESAVIFGNYIGTDSSGLTALANHAEGVQLRGTHAQVGGSANERNVISGNGTIGVSVLGDGVTDDSNVIEGNYIGTRADGTGAVPNGHGVFIAASDGNFIGGDGLVPNVIAGNGGTGVWLLQGSSGNTIEGNTIKANGEDGVLAESGPNAITSNVIRDSGRNGVRVTSGGSGVTISSNNMQANGALGINLVGGSENAFGVTANDTNDPDTGANGRQNFPILVSAVRNSATRVTEVVVTLDSTPRTQFRFELFRAIPDPSGSGEGGARIAVNVTSTDDKGDKTFSFLISGIVAGTRLTATATATGTGNTSEFSANRTIVAGP
jgi:parallel beta-helix repeat protein